MHPDLFKLLGVAFPSYFVLLLSGFLFATAVGALWARRVGESPDVIVDLGLAMLLAGVVGARLLHVVADGYFWDYVHLCTDPAKVVWPVERGECLSPAYGGVWDAAAGVCHPAATDCFAWAKFWAGGLTYYGGLVGASAVAWLLLKRDGFPFWKAADMAGFAIPLGLGFGRMGCLMAGCCFGVHVPSCRGRSRSPGGAPRATSSSAITCSRRPKMWSLPVHPTQIYESAASLAIAAVCLLWVHGSKRYDGQVFAAFLALYAIARFLLETLRRDDRGGALGLSTSQWLGLVMLGAAAAIHLARGRRSALPARATAP